MTVVRKTVGSYGRRAAWLSALWVLVLYSNLPIYIGTYITPILQPLHWIAMLFLLTVIAVFLSDETLLFRPLTFPLVLATYGGICLAWYVGQEGGDPVVLRQRLLGLAVCAIAYLVLSTNEASLMAARRALVTVVIFSISINLWDISHPHTIIPIYSEFATVGRAAGFFINPNQSGAALVLGFALTIDVIPKRWRITYLIAVAAGVAVTLSRAAMLGFLIVCLGVTAGKGPITPRQLLAAALIGMALAWMSWLALSAEIRQQFNIDPAILIDRVLWILDPSGRADFSQQERIYLLQRGLEQFYASPIFGNGLGSTELWAERTSTHNLYIMLASDFGVIGLLVLPAIVLAGMGSLPSCARASTIAGIFVLFWGLFSHNVLGEFYLLVGISLLAAISRSGAAADSKAHHRPV